MSEVALPRLRLLLAGLEEGGREWESWQAERAQSRHSARIAVQRVPAPPAGIAAPAVGIGIEETLRWFAPIGDGASRRLVFEYAALLLDGGAECAAPEALRPLAATSIAAAQSSDDSLAGHAIVLLSHAETDLLALERARPTLPRDLPAVVGHSLAGVAGVQDLLQRIGRRGPGLAVVIRVHGTGAAVPGLEALMDIAASESWKVVTISGISAASDGFPRSAGISADCASRLTRYFLEGGPTNVAQAMGCVASELLGLRIAHREPQPMPAHGLYHPDLLLTSSAEWESYRDPAKPAAWVLFYRAHVLSGNLEFVDAAIRALEARGLTAVGVFTSSLRERDAEGVPRALRLLPALPDILICTVSYPVFTSSAIDAAPASAAQSPFERLGVPLLQGICCATPRAQWQASGRGLPPAEAAMNVALPECDGRLIGPPISFKESHRYAPDLERLARLAGVASGIVRLRRQPNDQRRVAVILNNIGGKAQRIGSAVGLDAPASLLALLQTMRAAGYATGPLPASAEALMARLLARGSYDEAFPLDAAVAGRLSRKGYAGWFNAQAEGFRDQMSRQWGTPTETGPTVAPPLWHGAKASSERRAFLTLTEPHSDEEDYLFAVLPLGNVLVAVQPPRAYGMDAETMYHSGDLPPTHHYAAFYRWIAAEWQADAVVHLGAHGTLEWLPGKSVALSAQCAPDVLLGELPLIYPFVVNNPGEAAQAKRRSHALIIDHLTPPVTEAGSYGALAQLSRLVEDYYRAEAFDPGKLPLLRQQIWEWIRTARLEEDLRQIRLERHGDHTHGWDDRPNMDGVPRALDQLSGRAFAHLVEDLDAYLCDLGRAQIRGGLHVLGRAPQGEALIELILALARSPHGGVRSLPDALAEVMVLDLKALEAATGLWSRAVPECLELREQPVTAAQVRGAFETFAREVVRALARAGFASEAIDSVLAARLGSVQATPGYRATQEVLAFICATLAPRLARTTDEIGNILAGLEGRYVPAGAAGSPLRGMAHVLPTGRNLYTVDPRTLPTPAAWTSGQRLAAAVLDQFRRECGAFPESIALSVWGTPTMRTGGDDFAQALALIGVRPRWEPESRRLSGFEIMSLDELARPRIDVTLRVSGFFRDAFASLMYVFAQAVAAVARLDESLEQNFVRKHWLASMRELTARGYEPQAAERTAALRVFSSKPGQYGTGLMEAIDAGGWQGEQDLAEVAIRHGSWGYSAESPEGIESTALFRRRLSEVELVLHTQDVAENDILDSSETFEYQGGLIAAVKAASGRSPRAYLGDVTRPERAEVRTLKGQILRVFRSRIVNPKWIAAMRGHGYRGGQEMAAAVDALFGFSATSAAVSDEVFEGVAATLASPENQAFLRRHNIWALNAIAQRLLEAQQRGLWRARRETVEGLRAALLESESAIEEAAEHEL